MKSTITLEGAKKAVYFPFKGERSGTRLLIGSLITLAIYLPVVGIVAAIPLSGYFGQIMKRVIAEDEDPVLPEWKQWGTLFQDGLRIAAASLVYLLPGLLFMIGGYVLFMVLDFALAFSSASTNSLSSAFLGNLVGMVAGLGLAWVGMLLMLLGSVFLPPALGNLIARDRFEAAFRIKEWWPVLKANLGGYLVAIALVLGIYLLMILVAMSLYVTVILCILIPFALCIGIFLLGAMAFSLFGVSYRDGQRQLVGKGFEEVE